MVLTWQTAVGAAAGLATVIGLMKLIMGSYNKGYDLVKHQKEQDENIKDIKKDIQSVKDEQSILVSGILACLKGLQKQGADGPVTEAIAQIENHINKKAHM